MTKNSVSYSRTKYIDVRHYFVREIYEARTNIHRDRKMMTDILIMALFTTKHCFCIRNFLFKLSREIIWHFFFKGKK